MALQQFQTKLAGSKYSKNDKNWFAKWLRRYQRSLHDNSVRVGPDQNLVVTTASVIDFSRSLLKSQTPAWQRLQAVRAVEAYRDLVLETSEPSLLDIRNTLARLAAREQVQKPGEPDASGSVTPRDVVGEIDPTEPQVIQAMRRELRLRYKELTTERAYVGWVKKFARFCRSDDLESFAEPHIKKFLTTLAVDQNLAPNSQNQAKSALLFLYQQVFGRELEFLDFIAADKPGRLPVVLSQEEIRLLLTQFMGVKRLMFLLMYGTPSCQRIFFRQ